jgi:hypothetical protein
MIDLLALAWVGIGRTDSFALVLSGPVTALLLDFGANAWQGCWQRLTLIGSILGRRR